VVAIHCPGVRECGLNYSFTVAKTTQLGVRDDVLQEGMALSAPKKIRCCNKHARRSDAVAIVGHEDKHTIPLQCFPPDFFGSVWRLSGSAHLRSSEKREE
jgi:hypothetical protein